jgi:hypothetical protein
MTAAQRLQARIDRRTLWDVEADIREVLAENVRLQGERDQARRIARSFLQPFGHLTVHTALTDSLGLDAMPDWLAGEPLTAITEERP